MLFTSNSRTFWWYSNRARIDGLCIYSSTLEMVHFHKGLSWNFQSILGYGLIPGGKEKDKARQTVFPTPTNLFGTDREKKIVCSSRNPERLGGRNIQPENFSDRIIFMSMFNDIEWKTNDDCMWNAEKVKNYEMKFSQGHWTFLGRKRSDMAILLTLKNGNGIVQRTNWYKDSKKLVILCSKVSVL